MEKINREYTEMVALTSLSLVLVFSFVAACIPFFGPFFLGLLLTTGRVHTFLRINTPAKPLVLGLMIVIAALVQYIPYALIRGNNQMALHQVIVFLIVCGGIFLKEYGEKRIPD